MYVNNNWEEEPVPELSAILMHLDGMDDGRFHFCIFKSSLWDPIKASKPIIFNKITIEIPSNSLTNPMKFHFLSIRTMFLDVFWWTPVNSQKSWPFKTVAFLHLLPLPAAAAAAGGLQRVQHRLALGARPGLRGGRLDAQQGALGAVGVRKVSDGAVWSISWETWQVF